METGNKTTKKQNICVHTFDQKTACCTLIYGVVKGRCLSHDMIMSVMMYKQCVIDTLTGDKPLRRNNVLLNRHSLLHGSTTPTVYPTVHSRRKFTVSKIKICCGSGVGFLLAEE